MESDGEENQQQFANKGGEALDLGDDFDSEEEGEDEEDEEENQMEQPQQQFQKNTGGELPAAQKHGISPTKQDVKGQQVENQPFDLAVEVNDSEEIESDEEEDEVNMEGQVPSQAQQIQQQQQKNAIAQSQKAPSQLPQQKPQPKKQEDDEDSDEEKAVPGMYNPADYAGLQVSQEVRDLFEYILRYKPQKIDLESKLKPFVPEYIPAVGEVDSFLKMPKPDGSKEDLGITVLDEPAMNNEDKTVLEMKYIQGKNVVRSAPMQVDSIDQAEKKPKEISRWIHNVQDLHKTRPAPTVNYTKQMPNPDLLMEEWPRDMEQALKEIPFPGPEIDMHTADYARLVCSMVDIPSHKLANNKSVVESLHMLFTLYSDFKQNQHFGDNQQQDFDGQDIAQF